MSGVLPHLSRRLTSLIAPLTSTPRLSIDGMPVDGVKLLAAQVALYLPELMPAAKGWEQGARDYRPPGG
jgi:hypothetical protein